jgi:iron complex transport system substrate-binding protein
MTGGTRSRAGLGRILCLLALMFGPVATRASGEAITLLQADGEILSLARPADSIVTLAPNLAELVFAAGAGDQLEGVVEYSNFPPEAAKIKRVGDAFRIDLERIIELNPDLVIAWRSGNPQTALDKLQQLGVRVWQIEISTPEEIADTVENIARAAGTESAGRARAAQLRDRLAAIKQQNAGKTRLDYFFQISPHPLYTINGRHIISRSLAICGAHNVFADLPALAPSVSRESVIVADPQVMIAPDIPGEPPALQDWQDWPRLKAVQTGAMLYLPVDEISQATPRLLNSIELACKYFDEVRSSVLKPQE